MAENAEFSHFQHFGHKLVSQGSFEYCNVYNILQRVLFPTFHNKYHIADNLVHSFIEGCLNVSHTLQYDDLCHEFHDIVMFMIFYN